MGKCFKMIIDVSRNRFQTNPEKMEKRMAR